MNALHIYWPFKPFTITQPWGNIPYHYNLDGTQGEPVYKVLGFTRHNGIDANTGKINRDGSIATSYPVYCPVEGFTVFKVDYQPNGGGNEIWLRSNEKYQMFDQECYAWIVLCHAEKILVSEGYQPALGELLMIGDNTGFSTGPHTHMGLYRINDAGAKIDTNEASGSFDPSLFFIGDFAADRATLSTLIKSNLRYYHYRLGLPA